MRRIVSLLMIVPAATAGTWGPGNIPQGVSTDDEDDFMPPLIETLADLPSFSFVIQ
jgi:hypothetical protein